MTYPADINNASRLIKLALKDAGRLQAGDTPNSELYADCISRLYDLINTWQTQGLKLWLNFLQSVTLTAGVGTYTLGPGGAIISSKPTRVLEGWYVPSSGARWPLNPLSWNDYYRLGNVAQQGAVNSYFVDKQQLNLVVKLWQIPDASAALGTAQFLIQRQAVGPSEITEDVAFPLEWYMALRWGLADDLSSGQPQLIMDRCAQKAAMYRQMLEDWDVEDAPTRFAPDAQARPFASRFR